MEKSHEELHAFYLPISSVTREASVGTKSITNKSCRKNEPRILCLKNPCVKYCTVRDNCAEWSEFFRPVSDAARSDISSSCTVHFTGNSSWSFP
jgi:hypothetical protein